ncbi:MAG: hypothetical protein ACP5T3_00590 [Candidatus Micrarchaeia archaeon]
MNESKKTYSLILLLSTFLGALGQVFFKIGVMSAARLLLLVYIFIGIIFYLVSTVVYFYVLSRTHLSWTYGFTGLSYIFASLMAFAFLGEQVPLLRWLGIATIAIGTFLIGIS